MSRKSAMKKLEDAKKQNKVDPEIVPLLNKLNSTDYYTTSSCAGRIHLYEIAGFGSKFTVSHLGKWHSEVSEDEFLAAVHNHKQNELWLKVSPPIIHVGCPDLESAEKLLKIAYSSGFKYSSIKSTSPFLVEITSSELMEAPLGKDGKVFVDDEYLRYLVQMSNQKLGKSQSKIGRLKEKL